MIITTNKSGRPINQAVQIWIATVIHITKISYTSEMLIAMEDSYKVRRLTLQDVVEGNYLKVLAELTTVQF